MLTPQQIQEISFDKVLRGYDMGAVDDFLEPLTEDYITLYKENSVLKSKMRILVEKLEEYRRQEASMQSAIVSAQKTCDQMIAEAEKKCARLLHEATEMAAAKAENVDALVGTEKERLEAAQAATAHFIEGMKKRLNRQIELLEELRRTEVPNVAPKPAAKEENHVFDFDKEPTPPTTQEKADALIEEIGLHIEASLEAAEEGRKEQTEFEIVQENEKGEIFHGELPPAKRKLLDELQFGRNFDKK